jgi:AraC family transcriptional regulator
MRAARIAYHVAHAAEPGRDVLRRIGLDDGGAWSVYLLNGHGRAYEARGQGAFSIKWMADGRARYELERRAKTVSRDSVVLVDHQQPYEMEFEARSGGQSFCLFYSPDLVAEAWASVEAGFDEPASPALRPFPNVPFRPSPRLEALLGALWRDGPDAEAIEDRALGALAEAVKAAHGHRRLAERTPAARPAARAHLVGVVERARAELDARRGVGASLDEVARLAGVSKFHLVRLFKALHGVTPMAYAERARMTAAEERLRSGAAPIGEVAADLGYDSPSAFAKAFRRWTGAAPTQAFAPRRRST